MIEQHTRDDVCSYLLTRTHVYGARGRIYIEFCMHISIDGMISRFSRSSRSSRARARAAPCAPAACSRSGPPSARGARGTRSRRRPAPPPLRRRPRSCASARSPGPSSHGAPRTNFHIFHQQHITTYIDRACTYIYGNCIIYITRAKAPPARAPTSPRRSLCLCSFSSLLKCSCSTP